MGPMSTGRTGLVLLAAVLVLGALLGIVGSLDHGGPGDSGGRSDGKDTQTWPKSYSATSCREWLTRMTSSQRFVAAAEMLTAARTERDARSAPPSDSLIRDFAGGLDDVCPTAPTSALADAGAAVYLTASRFAP